METNLKDRLANALQYPRSLIRNEMNLEDCVREGRLDKQALHCRDCDQQDTCEWLLSTDEYSDIEQASLDRLVDALGFAIESVHSLFNDGEHDLFCSCEACAWQRQANTLYSEARCYPGLGPPPQPH